MDENNPEEGPSLAAAAGKKRRARSADVAPSDVVDLSVVKMSLKSFCDATTPTGAILVSEIEQCVRGITRVTIEASRLLNLWALMEFEKGNEDLPEVTQTTLEWAFKLFARVGNRPPPGDSDKVFGAARDKYFAERALETELLFDYSGVEQMIKYACRQYQTNCENHVALNLRARVAKAFRRFFDDKLPQKFKAANRSKIIEYFLRRMAREAGPEAEASMWTRLTEAPTVETVEAVHQYVEFRAARYKDLPLDVGYHFDATTKDDPRSSDRVRPKWWKYLRWLYDLRQECGEEGKGRAFSLFPLAGFDAQHVRIDSIVLHGLLSRVAKLQKCAATDNADKAVSTTKLESRTAFSSKAGGAAHWAKYFRVGAVEGPKRGFFKQSITTDGYSVSITLACPTAAVEPNNAAAGKRKKKTKNGKGSHTEQHPFVAGSRVVGVDPGRADLVSCAWYDDGRVDDAAGLCSKIKGTSNTARLSRYSNGEYQSKIGLDKANRKRKHWYEVADMTAELENLPSGKAASSAAMLDHIRALVAPPSTTNKDALLDRVLEQNFRRRVRSLRFEQYGRRQRVMHDICDRIVLGGAAVPMRSAKKKKAAPQHVVVAFGAGMFSSCSKGHAPGPVKAIRAALARRAGVRVVDVCEDYTSQLCHCCHTQLEPLQGILKDRKDKTIRYQGAVHGVRRCVSAKGGHECCRRKTLNRDTNAALNMLYVFAAELALGQRPAVFTRARQQALRNSNSSPTTTTVSSVPEMENGHVGGISLHTTTDVVSRQNDEDLSGNKPKLI